MNDQTFVAVLLVSDVDFVATVFRDEAAGGVHADDENEGSAGESLVVEKIPDVVVDAASASGLGKNCMISIF